LWTCANALKALLPNSLDLQQLSCFIEASITVYEQSKNYKVCIGILEMILMCHQQKLATPLQFQRLLALLGQEHEFINESNIACMHYRAKFLDLINSITKYKWNI